MEKKQKGYVEQALKDAVCRADAAVVVGEPFITPNGATIIPVVKSSTVVLVGSGEYGEVGLFSGKKEYPATQGGGSAAMVKPYGFIVERGEKIEFIPCPETTAEKFFSNLLKLLGENEQK